jgi:hypothetical protein
MSRICLGILYRGISKHYNSHRRNIEGVRTNMVVSGQFGNKLVFITLM